MNKVNIVFGDKNVEFRFGIGFMGHLLEALGYSIEDTMTKLQENPFKLIPQLMHESHVYDAYRKGEDSKYTLFDFLDMIDETGGMASSGFAAFTKAFTESMTKDVPKPSANPKKRKPSKAIAKPQTK
ncbi:hypothetical protein N9928_01135 [bacterium]|nr:hypothetical protein [bacterium]